MFPQFYPGMGVLGPLVKGPQGCAVEAKDLDEAIGWAAKIPSAADGSIEVRPIMEFGDHEH